MTVFSSGNVYSQSDPEITQKLSDIFFTDSQNGWVIGDSGFIARTNDGGISWSKSPTSVIDSLTTLFFIDAVHGWVGGENGILLKTTDSGNSWQSTPTNSEEIILDIEFANNDIGWFSDGTGAYSTENGGATWEKIIDSLGIAFLSVLDSNIVWFEEDVFRVYRSADGGNSIENIPSGFAYIGICGAWTEDFDMANDSTGLMVGTVWCLNISFKDSIDYFPLLIELLSKDSLLWMPSQAQGTGSEPLDAVQFLTEKIVWSVGEFGTIIKSQNGGIIWVKQLSGTETDLFSMSFIDTLTGWVLGKNNLILHTTDGGENWSTLVSIDNKEYNIPNEFTLLQNYPNPFNPVTKIEYVLPVGSEISLIIYNLLGREVARVVDGEQSAGNHTVRWDASNFASGIYFYRLQAGPAAGGFVQTRKMVLLK
ncbi:MAG: T9SS type A sorting domain-containing protein [Candidatus Marinimicrobia bacterium]|nr:T9SS type A sorting domain-containing protein [Candidatus Neomarinimicrobiota bacterium]